ncbi:LysM peptidoglycan-binding domain-containing protein [Luteolibacter yonseiensis]|uniref:LysM peptidoglycan-binding domain-containing protein n=1 Tax=Luteolibacter yonseiensis TaxID=1144680 RepID=A0A934R2Z8_9BACT|nr:LysM domain-containing protein [Luteolibacter yonseiensis]MBK1814360.1 LysM peptidoglycan-binding domain-containing protein [Luteolibacter yonseiensis]
MKPHTLPVKRRPAPKGIFKRLRAVTGNRRQRVAATAEMEGEDSSSKISRALTIIFLIHIVAIALIFVHQKFLDGRAPEEAQAQKPEVVAPVAPKEDLPRLSSGDRSYVPTQGDNYTRIASRLGVDEGDLRLVNKHMDIVPGRIMLIPPKRPVAPPVAEVAATQAPAPVAVPQSEGLVPAVDVNDAPRARLVKPNVASATAAASAAAPVTASGKTYVVQNGDSVWRIANRFKVKQDKLMKANGISDARKMKVGMSLVIPN